MHRPTSRSIGAALIALLAAALLPAAAGADTLLSQTLTAPANGAKSCAAGPAAGAGIVQRRVTLPAGGIVTGHLTAASGDWDLAIFEAGTNRLVSNGGAFGANEVAQGFVTGSRELIVQACRRKGESRTAKLSVTSIALPSDYSPVKASLLRVKTPTDADKARLQSLDLDLTEHAGPGFVEVLAFGAEDRKTLQDNGFEYTVSDDDLVKSDLARAVADRNFALDTKRSSLPSGRDSYRRLGDIEAELKALSERFPTLTKPITLKNKSLEGRDVTGLEVTENAGAVNDGKPVYLQLGVHHAREWPSAEMPMEFLNELLNGYGTNERITRLVKRVRVIFVPVVNVDGFNISREAPVDVVNQPIYSQIPDADPVIDSETAQGDAQNAYLVDPFFNYKRRNCRLAPGQTPPPGACGTPPFRLSGVDPNRNYGQFWGGPGASALPAYDTYRGEGPFSEPETQNIRTLVSERQVTNLITNHTFSNLILRPPGIRAQGPSPDEAAYKALGDAMAAQNGYKSDFSYGLYDTTGTTEDWSYYATGGFGFTFEHGPDTVEQDCGGFHPAYECVVNLYEHGQNNAGGVREAFFISMENAADAKNHSQLVGEVPPGVTLRLHKEFVSETSPVRPAEGDAVDQPVSPEGDKILFPDTLDTTIDVPEGGPFQWDINPSTRPFVAANRYRTVSETPTRTFEFQKTKQTAPNPSGQEGSEANYEDHPFTINPDEDGRTAIITVEWLGADDYDIVIYRKTAGEPEEVGDSGNFPGTPEEFVMENAKAGDYFVRVINYLGFTPYTGKVDVYGLGDEVVKAGTTETWNFTCEAGGKIIAGQKILVARGEQLEVKEPCGPNAREVVASVVTPSSAPVACASRAGFRSVKARPRGDRSRVELAFARRLAEPVNVDVFQVSKGRSVLREHRVARFRNLTTAFTWNGRGNDGKPITDGVFFVRFRTQGRGRQDSRRITLVRRHRRFSVRRTFHRPNGCGLLYTAKLRRAVFGGRQRTPLSAAFRVGRLSRVTLAVRRGKRVVARRRLTVGPNVKQRVNFAAASLRRRGLYRVTITARAGGRSAKAILASERL